VLNSLAALTMKKTQKTQKTQKMHKTQSEIGRVNEA
jgi:hypothetical protein